MRKSLVVLTLLLIALCPLRLAMADDSEFGGYGANIYPLQNSEIKLEYEWLTLNHLAYDQKATVEAIFIFKNLGGAKTITVGFPEALDLGDSEEGSPTIVDFKTFVDGKRADLLYQPLKKRNEKYQFDRAYLWKMHFKKGETHVVKNTYQLSPSASVMGDWSFAYILKTGALWAGKIGRIDIVVNSPVRIPWMAYVPYPEEYSHFHAVDWEPDRDIVVESWLQNDLALQYKGNPPKEYEHLYREEFKKPMIIYKEAAAKRRVLIRDYITRLDDAALSTATQKELHLYINGIYATYGRSFKEKSWADYFKKKWWYEAKKGYTEKELTKRDAETVARLKRYL